jgi:two-component system, NtrC family, nitrogen regulation sensor histidine kinase NtrY
MVFGLIVSFTIVEETERKDLAFKKRFAEQLTLHNDIQGEVIMSEIADHVKKDELIASNLNNGFVKKEVIEERVRERYLGNYFDKYEVHFSYYNKTGMPYYSNELSGNLKQVKSGIINEEVDTWVSNLFFVTNFKKDFYSIYYHFIDLEFDGKYVGTIVIDYTLKKYISKSILPSLLRLSSVDGYKNIEQYNYAIYNGNELQYSVGDFNYNSPEFEVLLRNKSLQGKDFKIDGFNHYLDFGVGDKMIIVSSRINKFYKLLTNFSFHFLLVVFLLLVLLVLSSVSYFIKNKSSDFSTKIQTYMNMSTFAPMIILSVLILGLMASSYRKDQEFQFRNNAEILSSHVLGYLEEFKEQKIGLYELKNSIEKLSKYSGSDINIYDTNGELVISNQSLLFEAGVMSNLINPKASKQIFEMKHRLVELEENIGAFSYNTVYVALTTPETSEFMGVMSIPFFNSSKQMEAKKISALSIIINVFAIAFVLLLGVSFFVTKSLTSPLRLIANKLRKVETGSKNEPLYWDSNDELGLLISEYNLMLQKIEESKQTFAQSQKESAWKEMAQQVAHEIKNPLTPMKLKLQHLKRVLGESDDRANDAIDSLLDQVDTLSEIASSFSSFAKMPMPESKKINLSEVCQHVLSLYESTAEYSVNGELELNLKVLGDDKLIGRVLTNLILNGIESVPNDRIPDVVVNLKRNGKKIILSVSDNGIGIPKEIQSKVFVPNFTTKYSGSGIGLAVAKNGIEQMGGKIWFETKENEGTIFFIELNQLV